MFVNKLGTMHQPYKISTYAMEKNERLFFITMLELAQNTLDVSWVLDENAPDFIVVDVDQPDGKAFWQAHHAENNLIAVAPQNTFNAPWFLEKPIKIRTLADLLKRISIESPKESEPGLAVTNQDISNFFEELVSDTKSDDVFEPSLYLSGLLKNALQSGQPQRFSLGSLAPLYVLPEQRCCFYKAIDFSNLTPTQKVFYKVKVTQIERQPMTAEAINSAVQTEGLRKYPINTFLWASSLYASNGRLLADFSLDTPVRLKQWPDLSLLAHDSTHFRVAAFMLKNTVKLATVAAETQVELPAVFNFFNACMLTQLIETKGTDTVTDIKNTPPSHSNKHSLFKNILKRLTG
jgi:hypothetical protein